jgi:hypothetical protein
MRCNIGLTLRLGGVVCKLTPTNEWIGEINVKLEQSSSGAGIYCGQWPLLAILHPNFQCCNQYSHFKNYTLG